MGQTEAYTKKRQIEGAKKLIHIFTYTNAHGGRRRDYGDIDRRKDKHRLTIRISDCWGIQFQTSTYIHSAKCSRKVIQMELYTN